jgi:hypothetical protein
MRYFASKTDLQAFSSMLALFLLLSSFQLTAGLVIRTRSGQPEFILNICQPLQMFNGASTTSLGRTAPDLPRFVLFDQGTIRPNPIARIIEHRAAPETPPPKQLV